jgi:integrase
VTNFRRSTALYLTAMHYNRLTHCDGRATGLVLQTEDGQPWNAYRYRNWRVRKFKPAAKGTGLNVPYDLRHSYASLLIHGGQTVVEVADQLGHSPAVCLSTYAHVMRELRGARKLSPSAAVRKARKAVLAAGQVQHPGLDLASPDAVEEAR